MSLYTDVVDALERWRELRDEIPELAHNPFLFPRLGRRRRDGPFPDADGQLSTTAVMRIVRPIMLAADVPVEQALPAHTQAHIRAGSTWPSARVRVRSRKVASTNSR